MPQNSLLEQSTANHAISPGTATEYSLIWRMLDLLGFPGLALYLILGKTAVYLGLCAAGEHFWEYRVLARERMTQQLGYDSLHPSARSLRSHPEPVLLG